MGISTQQTGRLRPGAPRSEGWALTFLLLVVFINMAGFGVVIPLLPFYAETFGIAPWQVTILFSAFSVGQFFGEPIWGRLSDKVGRRPILIGTMLAGAVGYTLLAFAPTYGFAVAIRLVGGFASGNIATIQAYITDITPAERRAQRMGLIGSAFGVGFVVGPALGGLLTSPSMGAAGYRPPLFCAAALAAAASLGLALFVAESRHIADTPHVRDRLTQLRAAWQNVAVRRILMTTVVATGAFSAMEAIFGLWVHARFQWGPREVGLVFAFIGTLSAIAQGLLVGPIVARLGEVGTLATGLGITAASLFLQVVAPTGALVVAVTTFTVLGISMTQPSITALLSRAGDAAHQGELLGLNGAAGALSRILGPLVAGALFSGVGTNAPYLFAAAGTVPAIFLALSAGAAIRRQDAIASSRTAPARGAGSAAL